MSSTNISTELRELLQSAFGFSSFRPYQEDVCKAAALGQDLLLVMPTGAGKSLCYQLPGLARKDTTLVISPLVALMEDQVMKLKANGFHAERIHSGRAREESRAVCAEYLKGNLDFLFIAPERLAVPGFLEMLAKRKPSLIAVDEAHCISQWGHDFRPDYRMLGERLPILRPAPVIALTATATPKVQDDIVKQLGLAAEAGRFIHGFRRTNIAIEVYELNPSGRPEAIRELLSKVGRLPAIIYAPTRKKAEEISIELSNQFKTAAYHAGLGNKDRDQIQTAFLKNELDLVIATVAFGMGVDKPNIRTVIHAALPGSVEAYYQEIGRAGRDGKPSRAILMHAFIDRKTHDFFHERDYPEVGVLDRIYQTLVDGYPEPQDDVRHRSGVDPDVFEKALEKLWIHGGVIIDQDQNVSRGRETWSTAYVRQRNHKQDQLAMMAQFAESHGCRMLRLVKHFGDQEDDGRPCGLCDVCLPDAALAGRYRAMDANEAAIAQKILYELAANDFQATGRLHRDLFGDALERNRFERYLSALTRAGLILISDDSFEKDGRKIDFRRASLTSDGRALLRGGAATVGDTLREFVLLPEEQATSSKSRSRKSKVAKALKQAEAEGLEASPELVEALRAWRLGEARAKRLPAFRILSDKVLVAIAAARPRAQGDLLEIHGMGPKLVEKYGDKIISIVSTKNA